MTDNMHTRAAASFLADAATRCADMASKPADQASCDQAIAALESGLVASGAIEAPAMTKRDRAATVLSIETLRAKAETADAVDAMRLRAAAARLEADLVEAPAMVAQPVQQQQAYGAPRNDTAGPTADRGVTTRDLVLTHHSDPFILPANTLVMGVRDGMGAVSWAVQNVASLARLSGNLHDARHRFCFVPADAVERR